jgi:hypothetical protein
MVAYGLAGRSRWAEDGYHYISFSMVGLHYEMSIPDISPSLAAAGAASAESVATVGAAA